MKPRDDRLFRRFVGLGLVSLGLVAVAGGITLGLLSVRRGSLAESAEGSASPFTAPPAPQPEPFVPRVDARGLDRLPVVWVENRGQFEEGLRFQSSDPGPCVGLDPEGMVLGLRTLAGEEVEVRHKLVGGRANAQMEGVDRAPGRFGYYHGNDPSRWHPDVPGYHRVRVREVYPGIDLVWYGTEGELEYDFVVKPGADYRQIEMELEGVEGLELNQAGDLVASTEVRALVHREPRIYQIDGEDRLPIRGSFEIRGEDRYGFVVDGHDPTRTLVIDPIILVSTYLGRGGVRDLAVDTQGNAYVSGGAGIFPNDTVVAKINAAGTAIVYSIVIGGRGADIFSKIAVDPQGNACVSGLTDSIDFPVVHPIQPIYRGKTDAFVTKIDSTGSTLVFSTYLGGSSVDSPWDISTDREGSVYVVGHTRSTDFPLQSPFQPTYAGGFDDAFITKIDPLGTTFVYSTYLGGSSSEIAYSIDVDGAGHAYVAGATASWDFPLQSPLQPMLGGGSGDAYALKMNPAGSGLLFSTYLGGSDSEGVSAIVVDPLGDIHVAGSTLSTDFPLVSPFQPMAGGSRDGFVAKIDGESLTLVYSTYLGGMFDEQLYALAVDFAGRAYVTGDTGSLDFPVVNAIQPKLQRLHYCDAYVSVFETDGNPLLFSTYLGGTDQDEGRGIALDPAENILVAGQTISNDFPVVDPLRPPSPNHGQGFLTKISSLAWEQCQGIDQENVLFVNGQDGLSSGHRVRAPGTGPIELSIHQPSGGGNGKFFVHLNSKSPTSATVVTLPDALGPACFDFLIPPRGTATPAAIWSNVSRPEKIGPSRYFGSPIPDPPRAPAVFFQRPEGDPSNLPSGSVWTLQGVIKNPASLGPRTASVTNAIVLEVQ